MICWHFQVALCQRDPPVPQIPLRIQPELNISHNETQSCPTVHRLTANVGVLWFYYWETLNCTTLLPAPPYRPREYN